MKRRFSLLIVILLLQLVPIAHAQGTDTGLSRIWITTGSNKAIYEFNTNWGLLSQFVFPLTGSPSEIAVDTTTDPTSLWIVREVSGTLVNLSKDGTVLSTIDTEAPYGAYGPEGIDVDADGSLWFVTDPIYTHVPPDPGVPAVYHIARDGTLLGSFPTSAYDPASTSPQSIAVDPVDGSLWLADNTAEMIYHVTNVGGLIDSFGTPGNNAQGITIAIDMNNGTLWITDRTNDHVYNLTREGTTLSAFDLSSIGIVDPTGIAFERAEVNSPDLGLAGNFSVFGLAGAKLKLENGNPGVVGDIGLGPDGERDLKVGFIQGTFFIDPTVKTKHADTSISNGTVTTDLYQAMADALNASSDAANLNPTQVFKDIKDTQTINRNGPLTVVQVNKIDLKNGKILTLNGGSTDRFIINISNGMKLNKGSIIQLTGGLQAGNVLFNFVKRNAHVEIKSGRSVFGIFLAPQKDATVTIENQGTTVTGAVIAGKEISIKKDAQVIRAN